ncbi:radical SAM protein [Desulfogranum japonicum]|uniref:radical SAM protein n=1 Tax=Desulfogranum japonicum TaxID=231447 RepID=UPI0003FDE8F3|nr:radical SAM protein [Desulfogranum japonicum]
MDYQGEIIRPPSEANSIILQVTTGCSHNRCTFCGAYTDKQFKRKKWETIEQDLIFASTRCKRQKTLFLADGDALALPHEDLLVLLERIQYYLPWIRRISSYASVQNIARKTPGELSEYRNHKLQRIYLGLESGLDEVLKRVRKDVTSLDCIEMAQKIRCAGFFLSVTCLLGLGGTELSTEHADATAKVLTQMQPNQIAMLTLMLLPGTSLHNDWRAGRFQLPDQYGLLRELRMILVGMPAVRSQFFANHASNYLNIQGRLPRDRETMIAQLDNALAGKIHLKPEHFRRL